uniref:Uncharacterized protein n=1 Tax=Aegilops tauschii subsp. strangulata TaxID=200361 RepID=A0A453AA72_AEGTS
NVFPSLIHKTMLILCDVFFCRLCHCLLATCGASGIWPMATWIDDTRYSLSFFLGLEGQ